MEYNIEKVNDIATRNDLVCISFDTECIYCPGDLSNLLMKIADTLFPGHSITITERTSEDGLHYISTMCDGSRELIFHADTTSDWLPDDCFGQIENIPSVFGEGKVMYMINPAIGLTGQDILYYYGWETNLKKARSEGVPLMYPNEAITDTPEFKMLQESVAVTDKKGNNVVNRLFSNFSQLLNLVMRRSSDC